MKISPISVNSFFVPKVGFKQSSFVNFKAQQLESDVFVRTTNKPNSVSEADERKAALPEYLYHLTNRPCYEKIMQTGKINLSKDVIDGVFMFDMTDFQTNWRNTKNVSKTGSLAQSLLEQALKNEKGLVLLKIPTSSLDPMKVVVRPEDEVTEFIRSEHFSNLYTTYAEQGGIFNNKWALPKDLVEGHSPIKSKDYTDNGRAVEYVYQGNIDIEEVPVEKVLELPEMSKKTLWGYGIKHYADLFETIEQNA